MTKKTTMSAQQLKQTWKITPEHKKLQARLEHLRQFRRQHEQFRSVIERLLAKQRQQEQQQITDPSFVSIQIVDQSDSNAVDEIHQAFESFKNIDMLECSPDGAKIWNDAIKDYEERIEKVERRITARLREQLAKARNANEMFQIFARFHDLLVRQHVRNAIREYQTQLIQRVKIDIDQLHEKFKAKYSTSKAMKMSRITVDIPITTGSIIWAKQIEKQLVRYLKRVEDVLGSGWEQHVDRQRLKFEGDSFKQRLNTGPIFEDWLEKVRIEISLCYFCFDGFLRILGFQKIDERYWLHLQHRNYSNAERKRFPIENQFYTRSDHVDKRGKCKLTLIVFIEFLR